jgi:hypothetical protein
MDIPRNRWIEGAVTAAALFSAIQLCSAVSMPLSRSLSSLLLFASSFFGIQRIYSAVIDILIIVFKRRSPKAKPSA